MGSAAFRRVLQLHRDVPKAAEFYAKGLGFHVNVCTPRWAELQTGPFKLALLHSLPTPRMRVQSILKKSVNIDNKKYAFKCSQGLELYSCENKVHKGYSTLLSFTVTDINDTVMKLMQLGAELDGPIKHEIHGKVAALRCLDGHMLGLFEPL